MQLANLSHTITPHHHVIDRCHHSHHISSGVSSIITVWSMQQTAQPSPNTKADLGEVMAASSTE